MRAQRMAVSSIRALSPCQSVAAVGRIYLLVRRSTQSDSTIECEVPLAKDVIPNPQLAPADTTLVRSTRTANLDMLQVSNQDTSAPILLLPGPTEEDAETTASLAQDLRHLMSNTGPTIYLIRWKSYWAPQGQTRLAPLVRDLKEILNHLTKATAAPHIMALGHGALIVLHANGNDAVFDPKNSLSSLSFMYPRLDIQGRKPRLHPVIFLHKVSLIGSELDVKTIAPSLVKRVSRSSVELFEVENEHWFVRSQISADPAVFPDQTPRGYAGNWLRSWLDWLPQDNAIR